MIHDRRQFLRTSAVATLSGSALFRLLRAQQQAPQPVFTALRRNVGCFSMRGGTIGWLVNPGGVVVVDSQFPIEAGVFLEGLRERSARSTVEALLNTHHHGDHTAGNVVFRGVARRVVAHALAAEHMRQPPGANPPAADQLFPDTTFTDQWVLDVGNERIRARYYGRAHTSGDAVITFERANVAHLGDLMFHGRHPVVDRAAGATLRGWMEVLARAVGDHDAETVFIFGHSNPTLPVTGSGSDVLQFRDYMGAVWSWVESQVRAGRSREEVLATRDPLPGYEHFGPFGQPGPREIRTCAWEEITTSG
jgi:glyoxylase-like metal-dependent hydrolase (beta-lactamase superfamily II)